MTALDFALPVGFGVLAAVAAAIAIGRRRRRLRPPRTGWLTDAMVRDIVEHGRIEADTETPPPLDLEEIRREEDRFWAETWDRPEPQVE